MNTRTSQERADRASSDLMVRVTQHSGAQSGAEALSRRIEEGERTPGPPLRAHRGGGRGGGEGVGRVRVRVRRRERRRGRRSPRRTVPGTKRGRCWPRRCRGSTRRSTRRASRKGSSSPRSPASPPCRGVHEQRDWTSSGVRAVLHHFRNGGAQESAADGIFGVMGDLIETDAEYEKAVEAVLGERMQSVVVRGPRRRPVRHPLPEGIPRGQERLRPGGAADPGGSARATSGEEGVVGPLTSVVQAPPEYGELVRGLLGGTLLVRNLDTALRLWNRNGVWNSYVTLDGEVVTADGILIGGEQRRGAGAAEKGRPPRPRPGSSPAGGRSGSSRGRSRSCGGGGNAGWKRKRRSGGPARSSRSGARRCSGRGRARLRPTRRPCEGEGGHRGDALAGARPARRAHAGRGVPPRGAGEDGRGARRRPSPPRGRPGRRAGRRRSAPARCSPRSRRRGGSSRSAGSAPTRPRSPTTALEEKDRAAAALLASITEQAEGKRRLLAERDRRKTEYEESLVSLDAAMRAGRDAIEQAAVGLSGLQDRIDDRVADLAVAASRLSGIEEELRQARARESEAVERQSAERLRLQKIEMDIAAARRAAPPAVRDPPGGPPALRGGRRVRRGRRGRRRSSRRARKRAGSGCPRWAR